MHSSDLTGRTLMPLTARSAGFVIGQGAGRADRSGGGGGSVSANPVASAPAAAPIPRAVMASATRCWPAPRRAAAASKAAMLPTGRSERRSPLIPPGGRRPAVGVAGDHYTSAYADGSERRDATGLHGDQASPRCRGQLAKSARAVIDEVLRMADERCGVCAVMPRLG